MADEPKIREAGCRQYGDDCQITVGGMRKAELETFQGFLLGTCWLRIGDDRRLQSQPRFAALPAPVEDAALAPHWPPAPSAPRQQMFPHSVRNPGEYESPSFIIQHLCGYYYSPENYKKVADNLESWGFACLRSRRGDNGRYWEIWYLPGLWASAGALRESLDKTMAGKSLSSTEATDAALSFLCHNASFGTLDISSQRAAMVIDPE